MRCGRCGYLREYHTGSALRCPELKTGGFVERPEIDPALWPEIMIRDSTTRTIAMQLYPDEWREGSDAARAKLFKQAAEVLAESGGVQKRTVRTNVPSQSSVLDKEWQQNAALKVGYAKEKQCPIPDCKGDHATCSFTQGRFGCSEPTCKNPHHSGMDHEYESSMVFWNEDFCGHLNEFDDTCGRPQWEHRAWIGGQQQ